MTRLLQALLLLAYLVGGSPESKVPPQFDGWRQVVQAFDLAHDLCDPCDVFSTYTTEVSWAYRQYRECQRYPGTRDFAGLPARETTERAVAFGYEYHERNPNAVDHLAEHFGPWYVLRMAHREPWRADKRRHLDTLRAKLGPAAYYNGAMPSPAPFHLSVEVEGGPQK